MDSYVFRNEMKFGNRAAQRKLLLRLAGVLLLAVFVLKTVLDGFSVITLWLVLLGLIFLGRKGSPVTVEDVLTEISFAPGHVTLVYRGIDRHDGQGLRTEVYEMEADRIKTIRYNDKYRMLELISQSVLTVRLGSGSVTRDFSHTGQRDRQVLWLKDDDTRGHILEKIQEVQEEWRR